MNFMRKPFFAVTVLCAAGTLAQDVTWDGNGTPNNDGDWNTAVNWDSDAVPTVAGSVTNRAILPSVSGGVRVVTQDAVAGTTAGAVRFLQDGTTGTNRLSLAGNLTLLKPSREGATEDSTASAFQVARTTGATTEQVVVDMNGYSIILPTFSGSGATGGGNLAGTFRFNATGSSFHTAYVGHTVINVFGDIEATGDGRIGRDTGGTSSTGNGTITMKPDARLTVSAGTFAFELAGRRGQDRSFTVSNSGMIEVGAGATVAQRWTATSASYNRGNIVFANQSSGVVRLTGSAAFRIHHATGGTNATLAIQNFGLWSVDAGDATIMRLTTSQDTAYIAIPLFTNAVGGTLCGSGADDTLEFDEEVADGTRRMLLENSGTIAPGAGSQGSSLASVGILRLRDTDVTFRADGMLTLDLGGTAAGQHDQLLLETGATKPAGAGTLDLTAGGTLQLHAVNGFAPTTRFTVDLATAGSVAGAFATVKLDDATFTDNELVVPDAGTLVVDYTDTAVRLNFVPDSEPTTVVLLR